MGVTQCSLKPEHPVAGNRQTPYAPSGRWDTAWQVKEPHHDLCPFTDKAQKLHKCDIVQKGPHTMGFHSDERPRTARIATDREGSEREYLPFTDSSGLASSLSTTVWEHVVGISITV